MLTQVRRPRLALQLRPEPARAAGAVAFTVEKSPPADAARHKLWELDPGLLCSILGTCLDIEDLRRIARKAGLNVSATLRDYDIHGYFVTHCSARSSLSKQAHKALDRRYTTQVACYRSLRSPEDLWAQWQESVSEGDVSGGYWALMTHPATPPALQSRAHSEVHMLSHLMGHSSRDSLRRVRELEATCAELSDRLERTRTRHDGALKERDERIASLQAHLAASHLAPAEPPSVAPPQARMVLRQLERLRARYAVLERRLKAERSRARSAEGRLTTLLGSHAPSADTRVAAAVPAPQAIGSAPAPTDVDLRGTAVLYVGGHANVAPHLREHTQRMNAAFLYHDGGIEAHNSQLPGLVSQARAVFCPVDCVSHDACLQLKQLCKRQGKCLVLLRSAGLSSFVTALHNWAQRASAPA